MKRILTILMMLSLLPVSLTGCGKASDLTVLDASGEPVENTAYQQIAEQEAVQILMDTYDCSEEAAQSKLNANSYTLYTSYQPEIFEALKSACSEQAADLAAGCAVTDLEGNLSAMHPHRIGVFPPGQNPGCV